MDNNTVVVLANPTEPQLAMLEQLPPETGISVGNTIEAFERAAPFANVIYNWSLSGKMLREVFLRCPNVQWVHSRAAGLDNVLFPELIESEVPLTNGSGVFSQSLGEFVLGAILDFLSMAYMLGFVVLWLGLMYKAYNGEKLMLPLVGAMAEQQA